MYPIPYLIDTVFLGRLNKETIINKNKGIFIDESGGNLLYSAYASRLWGKTAGIVSKVGVDYPEEWIEEINLHGVDVSGVIKISGDIETRQFFSISENDEVYTDNPQKFFLELDRPIPKSLLGYAPINKRLDSRKICEEITIKPEDIPDEYFDCHNIALCPLDFVTHSIIPAEFRSRGSGRIYFHASKGYMHSSFFTDLPPLVNSSTLFFTSEENARNLFLGKKENCWEIAEYISSFGVEITVISNLNEGYYLFIQSSKQKFFIPCFPVNVLDLVGADDAFFGGFIAGYIKYFDPIIASAMGSVTASIKKEGSTAQFLLESLPELATGRLEKLSQEIKPC